MTLALALMVLVQLFFKYFWNLVSPRILDLFDEFYNNSADLQRINKFYIVLLPKQKLVLLGLTNFDPSPYEVAL